MTEYHNYLAASLGAPAMPGPCQQAQPHQSGDYGGTWRCSDAAPPPLPAQRRRGLAAELGKA